MTSLKLKKLVKSGAVHPLALVRDKIIAKGVSHPIWQDTDLTEFPWPCGRTLFDLVAKVAQEEFLRLAISEKHYYRMLDKVELEIFGRTNPERSL